MVALEQVRAACVAILNTIICYGGYFGQTKLSLKLPKDLHSKEEALLQPDTGKSKPLPELTNYYAVLLLR